MLYTVQIRLNGSWHNLAGFVNVVAVEATTGCAYARYHRDIARIVDSAGKVTWNL